MDSVYRIPRANPLYTKLMRRPKSNREAQILRDRKTVINNRIPRRIYDDFNTRISYIRYADDFIVGIAGSKAYTFQVKTKIAQFLLRELGLRMSMDKTKVTNLVSRRAFFLGAWIHRTPRRKLPYKGGLILTPRIIISAPVSLLVDKFIKDGIGKKTGGGGFKP